MNNLYFEHNSVPWDLPCPFTIVNLVYARPFMVWGYRRVWPTVEWILRDTDNNSAAPNFERNYPKLRETRERWLKELGKNSDYLCNHQTFLVSMNNKLYYVMFHDGNIWVGTSASEE